MKWKRIKNTDDYYISDCGDVVRKYNNEYYLCKRKIVDGYPLVKITRTINGHKRSLWMQVRRLVANHFINNIFNLNYLYAVNGIKDDCRKENIRWTCFDYHPAIYLPKYNKKWIEMYSKCAIGLFDKRSGRLIFVFKDLAQASQFTGVDELTIINNFKPFRRRPSSSEYNFGVI